MGAHHGPPGTPPVILHTVFVTYNRLQLTQQAIASFLATVTVPYTYLVVDNGSTDGTPDWLQQEGHPALLLGANHYPGYATNRGWEQTPPQATHLQRADNDMVFLPDWCQELARAFRGPKVGQVGLRTDPEENHVKSNVGGNMVIRRKLFKQGLRYDERPWPQYQPGFSEDSYLSPAVRKMGYRWARVTNPCLLSLATNDWSDEYYVKSFGDRRIRKGTV